VTDDAGSKARVLVVDDDPGIVSFVAMLLESEGFDVDTAVNGVEAMERVVDAPPDLVLLDIAMPRMDGREVARRLRDHRTPPPVIMMSAGFDARQEAQVHRAEGFLKKPFSAGDLLECIDGVLRRRRMDSGA